MRDEFLGTFGLIGGTEVLDAALQNIDTIAQGESHLCVAPEIPNWESQTPSMIKYCILALKEGKNNSREGPGSKLNRLCMVTEPLSLQTESMETHPIQF